jgi:predicted porin
MKKTLVALAVLAASGASFAQVTITGQYGYGFKSTTTGSATSSGLGVSDSNIVFSSSEDLGGGMKASAQVKIDGINRAGIGGGDSFVTLSGGFGTVTLGLAEYDTDLPDSFGTFMGATIATAGGVDSERTTDFAQYATSFGPVGVSVRHTEADKALGAGSAGSAAQRLNTVAATYAAGPLSAKVDYSVYDNKDGVAPAYDTRTTIGGNYDLGVVKLGLGYQKAAWTHGVSVTDTFVGATIPLGALAVGVDYLSSKLDGSVADDKTYTGTGVQATYSLSKRTNIRFRYNSFDKTLSNVDKTTSFALALYHNF